MVMLIAVFALLNRMRGDDEWMGPLPGRALYYVSILVGLLSYSLHSWQISLTFGLTYLFWGVFAWGRWFDLGRLPDNWNREGQEPSLSERFVQALSWNDHSAMVVRHYFAAPGLLAIWWLGGDVLWAALTFGVIVMLLYELAWRVRPQSPIIIAELMTGAFWGLIVVIA